jgi:hypothetical protein
MNRFATTLLALLVMLSAACATAPAKPLNGHYALFVDTAYASVPVEFADFVVSAMQERLSIELVADPAAAGTYDALIIVHLPSNLGSAQLGPRTVAGGGATNVDASGAPDAGGGSYVASGGTEGTMTYEILRGGRPAGEGGVRVELPRGSGSERMARLNATAPKAARALAEDVARKLAR